ncbi:MAG: hypothetical protein ABL892_08075 [Thiobacillaceae bacterium]
MTKNAFNVSKHQQTIRVGIIGACYYHSPARFSRFSASFIRGLLPDTSPTYKRYVSMRPSIFESSDHAQWIECSSQYLDISAYVCGMASVEDADLHLFFNDTLFIKHPWRLIAKRLRATLQSLAAVVEPAAAGEIHPSTDLLLFDPRNPTRRHMSTFCFLLNRAGFAVFKEVAATLPIEGSNGQIRDWLEEHARNNAALKHLLHVHLTGPESPWSWKSVFINRIPEDLVLRKAVTVTFEYLLSEQLLQRGGFIMPINFRLSYRLQAKIAAFFGRFRHS